MQDYRSVSRRYITLSVFYIVAGFTMMFWPHLTMAVLGKALGIAMLVIGLAYVVFYFTKDHLQGILEMDLTIGVVLAAFGFFILLHADFVGLSIPFAVGVVIIVGGISKIQFALDMRRLHMKRWNVLLICSVLIILCGVVLIYNPFNETVLIFFMAGCMVADGLLSIISVLTITHHMKLIDRGKVPPYRPMHETSGKPMDPPMYPAPRNHSGVFGMKPPHVDGEIVEDK